MGVYVRPQNRKLEGHSEILIQRHSVNINHHDLPNFDDITYWNVTCIIHILIHSNPYTLTLVPFDGHNRCRAYESTNVNFSSRLVGIPTIPPTSAISIYLHNTGRLDSLWVTHPERLPRETEQRKHLRLRRTPRNKFDPPLSLLTEKNVRNGCEKMESMKRWKWSELTHLSCAAVAKITSNIGQLSSAALTSVWAFLMSCKDWKVTVTLYCARPYWTMDAGRSRGLKSLMSGYNNNVNIKMENR